LDSAFAVDAKAVFFVFFHGFAKKKRGFLLLMLNMLL